MSIHTQSLLWQQARVKVFDVRKAVLQPGEDASFLRLPTNIYLYIDSGKGQLHADGIAHVIDTHYLCHAGKGTSLRLHGVTAAVHYYLIFYKASLPKPYRSELLELTRRTDPFGAWYSFVPVRPLILSTHLHNIYTCWHVDDPLEKLHVHSLFYKWVYEILKQRRHTLNLPEASTGIVTLATRYLEENYSHEITLRELAVQMGCSTRQLQRLFSEQYRLGPMDYLFQFRMEQAKRMLLTTSMPIKDIGFAVGFNDMYYFSRAFKKYAQVSPLQFRRNRAKSASRESIESLSAVQYSVDENHYHYSGEGDTPMLKKRLLTVNLLLIIMLLGACAGGGKGNTPNSLGTAGSTPVPTEITATAEQTAAAQQIFPVTVNHLKGELTLKQKPQRVAVLDAQYLDQLAALDESPAGSVKAAFAEEDFPEYLESRLNGITVLGTYQEPNLEAILEMDPDLIICTEFHEDIYDSLTKIADTVMLERNMDWRDALETFAKINGKEAEAQEVITAYKEKTERLAAELAAKLGDEKVALIRPRDNIIRIHTTSHRTAAVLYEDLGLQEPVQASTVTDTSFETSLEGLTEIDADHYFLVTDATFSQQVEDIQQSETWKSLKPVQNDHVYTVDSSLWIAYYGPIAINMVVDQIAEALLGNS